MDDENWEHWECVTVFEAACALVLGLEVIHGPIHTSGGWIQGWHDSDWCGWMKTQDLMDSYWFRDLIAESRRELI